MQIINNSLNLECGASIRGGRFTNRLMSGFVVLILVCQLNGYGEVSGFRLADVTWAVAHDEFNHTNLSETLPPESPAPEGWALFPGKDSPVDAINHGLVAIRARIEPPAAGVLVYFRVFDVDDPADDPRLDPNGDWGGDNDLATTPGAPGLILPEPATVIFDNARDQGFGAFTPVARAVTNATGEARILWEASRQPGDNFRAAATLAASDAEGLAILDSVSTRGLALAPPPIAAPGRFGVSPLLTTHRRLWVAIDKMAATPQYEPVTGRLVFGPEHGIVSAIGKHPTEPHIYYIADDDKATSWTRNPGMYQDSAYLPQERSCYLQPDPSHNTYFSIIGIVRHDGRSWIAVRTDWRFINTIEGWYLQQQPEPIALDDRATTGMPYRILTEDSAAAPEFPTIDHARRVFARCYVVAVEDPHLGGRTLPWIRNAGNDEIIACGRDIRMADPLYWQCYLLGGYEYTIIEDGDPDWHAMANYTPVTEGVTVRDIPEDFRYTAIFYEMAAENWAAVRDIKRFLDEKITAHELVHQFDVGHTLGLMEEFAEFREPWLHPPDIAIIRATRAP